ncbi:MarR family transcriptional regulator [Amycolatopsis sp. OK19-0408]|uniref:MarR family transcriptional regulator n=1 Tax=Amycolatopsis iheyensis TaxID=2945988 RepID=A0A9X2N9N9_9PSEU|nr:MarR family transcriptional regulator [Amycolatopsis iheyensis]MCR6483822.1 MarR family transcriptional regulator [Amycolatopsis iheyensis]
MQTLEDAAPGADPDVVALDGLTLVLVGIAWECAHTAPPEVSFPQTRLLLILDRLGRVPSSRLAAAMGVNASSVTRLADRLEALGYLTRGRDPRNRSVVTLEVTDTGHELVTRILDQRHAALGTLLDRLPPTQRKAAATAARRLVNAAATIPALGPAPL